MEKQSHTHIKETLLLTNYVFNTLLNKVLERFRTKHQIEKNPNDSQIYGFGNYNIEKPNLKNDLEVVLRGYINGKYLYNKYRESMTGKPVIKLSREYKYIYFNYIGFKDVNEFINNNFISKSQKNKQLDLLNQLSTIEDNYYVSYYYGEDNKMTKGQVIIYNHWKNIEMNYIYLDEKGVQSIYTFFGTVKTCEHFVHFNTNFFLNSKKTTGANFIFFIGISSPNERHYLIGTYSGFDKYDRAVAGKMILKKFALKSEIVEETASDSFDPIICQKLNKQRINVDSNIRKNPLLFSKKSPYAQVLSKTTGKYTFEFLLGKDSYALRFEIQKYHYNIISLTNSIIIEDDRISVINKGQVLILDFSITGIFHLQKVSVYVKTLDFFESPKTAKGNYNGVDINNNIVSGEVRISSI